MAKIESSSLPNGLPMHRIDLPGTRALTILVAFDAARWLPATLEALRDDALLTPHGLGQIPDLIRQLPSPGLTATLTTEGPRADLPAPVDRAAYRIVQESLTNIARHARATTATVHITYHPGRLTIRVDDDGTATPQAPPEPGIGLLGMRERVTALGGHLRAEPRPEGGFTVHAELPLPAATPEAS